MAFSLLLTFAFLASSVLADTGNDWSKPCLEGVCFYDLPATTETGSGTLKIWGSSAAITDITTAAGWEVLDCDSDANEQDIRLVCVDESKCEHLYKDIGAVGKVVRLPENCGKAAFAHIAAEQVSDDQTIPEEISRRLRRRDGVEPEVKTLHVDINFEAVDAAEVGEVFFALTGVNAPVPEGFDLEPIPLEKRGLEARGFWDNLVKAIKDLNTVEIDKSHNLPVFEIDKVFNLVDQQLYCPPISAHLRIDARAQARALATIGVAAEGTIIPPKVTDFAVIASLTGNVDAGINLTAGLSGNINTGKIKLYEVGIPGLNFPGILTIGPSFRVDAYANANLNVAANINIGLTYTLHQATLVFPADSKKGRDNGGAFKLDDTRNLQLGVNALGGVATANIYLELDAAAGLDLDFAARGDAGVIIGRSPEALESEVRGSDLIGSGYFNTPERRQVSGGANGSYNGCFGIFAGLDVNAGASAKFFNLFDVNNKVSLYSEDWELYRKCIGGQAGTSRRPVEPAFAKRALSCPLLPQGAELTNYLNQLISKNK
ncbi:hypothetical protein FA15DRAFT_649819 [Coprinopsis marcescibilis]|uniref:Uncharacterized protein n=1 Tax=Coprinopsis marcescibilis TaxID=230819 RepID=A0A5C3KDW7_COPMA|nr:hypothetical protein FA15DRAFT_649819 [Coprinopsis marcescibilis]